MRSRGRIMISKFSESDAGAVAIVVAAAMIALVGFTALVVDIGMLYAQRSQLQTAVDAAALAGVRELTGGPEKARLVAKEYVQLNSSSADEVSVAIETTMVENDTIKVTAVDTNLERIFAGVLGVGDGRVSATAKAVIGSPSTYNGGVMPFAVLAAGSAEPPYGYPNGASFNLLAPGGQVVSGNRNWADLSPFADKNHPKDIVAGGGSTKPISIGTEFNSQTGELDVAKRALGDWVSRNCIPHGISRLWRDPDTGLYEPRHADDGSACSRLLVCPVVILREGDPFAWVNASGTTGVKVVGFANILIENNLAKGDDGVIGTFVEVIPKDTIAYGAYTPYAGAVTWMLE